jgi:von Willebrand factor type A domain
MPRECKNVPAPIARPLVARRVWNARVVTHIPLDYFGSCGLAAARLLLSDPCALMVSRFSRASLLLARFCALLHRASVRFEPASRGDRRDLHIMTKHVRFLALLTLGGCLLMHGPYEDIDPIRARDGGTAIPGVGDDGAAVQDSWDGGAATPGVSQEKLCESFRVRGGRVVVPDVLIVLDRSSSMKRGDVNRWDPSVSGLKAITSALANGVRFGLMVFPGTSGGDDTASSCAPGSLEVPIALNNAAAIASRLDALGLALSTPTAPTLEVAHIVLKARRAQRGSTLGPAYVILVTDGSPNCAQEGDVSLEAGGSPAAVEQARRAIEAMSQDGIKTFVLGYDTERDPVLKPVLDGLAQAGATGDKTHRAVDNEAGLTAAFRDITRIAVGCAFNLSTPPLDWDHVSVNLAGAPLQAGDADGWSLGPDGRTLSIQGKACELLSNGDDAPVLEVGVRCAFVPVF